VENRLSERITRFYHNKGFRAEVESRPGAVAVTMSGRAPEQAPAAEIRRVVRLAEQGRHAEAEALLERLVAEYPASAEAHRLLGQLLFEQGRAEEALSHLEDAVRWDPEDAAALILLGTVHARHRRDTDAALAYFERAIALDPDNYLALNNIGGTLINAGREQEGEAYLRRALELNPRYPNAHYGLALLHARRGEYRDAFEHAVVATREAAPADPVHAPSRQLAEQAAQAFLEDVDQVALFQPYLEQVALESGKSIEVRPDESMAVAATLEIAEYRGRDRHVLRYKRSAPAFGHTVMHELAKLDLITQARHARTNRLFSTTPDSERAFRADITPALERLEKSGLSAEQVEGYTDALFRGLALQIYSAPVDLFIEDHLHERFPTLRPVQFLSLLAMHSEGLRSVTDAEVRRHAPPAVLEASTVYNLTSAYHLAELYGVDLAPELRKTNAGQIAARLYAEYQQKRGARAPGDEYELVEAWGEALGLADYFELIDEDEVGAGAVPAPTPARRRDPQSGAASRTAGTSADAGEEEAAGSFERGAATVIHLVEAMRFYRGKSRAEVQSAAFEVGMLGRSGLHPDDAEKKYTLRSAPGRRYSAPELLALMYVGFRLLDPTIDTGLDYLEHYREAERFVEEHG
jgi:Flp pilus assembly protein TadD